MHSILSTLCISLIALVFAFAAQVSHAAPTFPTETQQTGQSGGTQQTGQSSPVNVGTKPIQGNIQLFDPLGGKSLEDIFRSILDIIMVFAVPIILFFIVWAGFLYVTAGGKQEQVTKASRALLYAVIGGVLVLGAKVLLEVITNTIKLFS